MAARVGAADSYLAARPGAVGYVLRDRKTGAITLSDEDRRLIAAMLHSSDDDATY